MSLSYVIFLILFYLCTGFFFSFALVRQQALGRNYFIYHGLGFCLLLLVGWWFGYSHLTSLWQWGVVSFLILGGTFSLMAGKYYILSRFILGINLLLSLILIFSDLINTFPSGSHYFPQHFWFISNSLLSLSLSGITMAAMWLGHWYLVQPKLSINELRRISICFIGLVVLRFTLSSIAVFQIASSMTEMEIYKYFFGQIPGLFVTMRWFWGLLGPLILTYFIWETVRIRSTQSATGILYVAVVFVLGGEILSQYLTYYYGIPL